MLQLNNQGVCSFKIYQRDIKSIVALLNLFNLLYTGKINFSNMI